MPSQSQGGGESGRFDPYEIDKRGILLVCGDDEIALAAVCPVMTQGLIPEYAQRRSRSFKAGRNFCKVSMNMSGGVLCDV